MTPNATISIAVAQMEKADQYYKQIITQGIPLGNDGKPVPGILAVAPCLIPKGAKNIDAAKDLLKSFIRPDNLNQYLKETRGRFLPVMMSNIKSDPYWQDAADPHRPVAVDTGLVKPTISWWMKLQPSLFGRAVRTDMEPSGGQYHAEEHDPRAGSRGSGRKDQDDF